MTIRYAKIYTCNRCKVEVELEGDGYKEPEGWYCNKQLNFCPACYSAFRRFMDIKPAQIDPSVYINPTKVIEDSITKPWSWTTSPDQQETGTL